MANSPIPIGETLAQKYRIERIIGEGGMGVVVAAHHLELDQPVAIKFLLEGVSDHDEGAERFRREARAAAKIHSDNVVRVLDVGVLSDGIRYMVMEYLEGRDLAEELAERGSLPVGVSCGIILEALDAVAHAHAVGIVHRDLKPANLYLARRPDGSRRVKVLDFGISKSVGLATADQLSLTKTSAWIGSPLYMAPEQMQSARDVDSRADIWSIGAILYELISGHPPYEAESLPQLCNLLITTDPLPIEQRVSTVPSELSAVIMACLVRDPEKRTQTAAELAQGLARYATTATGSGVRVSMLDVTEMQGGFSPLSGPLSVTPSRASYPGVPFSENTPSRSAPHPSRITPHHSQPGHALGNRASTPSHAMSPPGSFDAPVPPGEKTYAAWGGTDHTIGSVRDGRSKGGAFKWGLLALLALSAGIGGFFAMKMNAPPPNQAELEAAMVAAPAVSAPSAREPELGAASAEREATAEHDAAEEQAETTSVEDTRREVSEAPPKPAPRAIWKPRPRPRPAAPPAPAPTAEVSEHSPPAPKPKDSFSEFGGRR